ncbi:retrovirus-related Pol polyprotein LINE-1 [Elysia marginata]|uniref:Retrovirus-related Pol polyprotein LINE-1 n=1 Tax=Elysia marginata TaxID=1093978 RepID=A0AAV4IVN9_9GAST|nr:retrovirus-related Pol polyprotein LINE-1 [Elysia marginata]
MYKIGHTDIYSCGEAAETVQHVLQDCQKYRTFKQFGAAKQTCRLNSGEPLKNWKNQQLHPSNGEEVKKSFDNLNNNRALGKDGIHAELLKYGTQELNEQIAKIFNQTFERHENLDINAGELIAIPKPGKPKGPPKNLRPITLLNTIRKALSKIVLERIRPHVEQYLSHSQSGFRPNRSTSDVAWTHKRLAAKVSIENIAIKIAGIDMPAAFDTINRETLLKILEDIVNEDEHRIIRFLLSNTIIGTKIIGASEKKPFFSNVGMPQGDSLSPVLFTIFLELAS